METAERLIAQVRQDKAHLICSIDDNLLDLESIPTSTRMVMRYFCREANGVVVSTEFLKDRLKHINSKIYVLPNCVDERLFMDNGKWRSPLSADEGHIVIGFMGTYTHDADLMMVLQALRTILYKYSGAVKLELVGGLSNSAFIQSLQGLPVRVCRVPVQDVEYPNFIDWMKKNIHWHIGIAPLEDTFFNRSKSDIKFLDYSALGIAGIYSHVLAYKNTIRHKETGYLTGNTPAEWVEALEQLILDRPMREKIALSAQQYVTSSRTLAQCGKNWQVAIQSIMNST